MCVHGGEEEEVEEKVRGGGAGGPCRCDDEGGACARWHWRSAQRDRETESARVCVCVCVSQGKGVRGGTLKMKLVSSHVRPDSQYRTGSFAAGGCSGVKTANLLRTQAVVCGWSMVTPDLDAWRRRGAAVVV